MTENLKPSLMLGFNHASNHYTTLPPSQKMVICLSSRGELMIRNYFKIQPRLNTMWYPGLDASIEKDILKVM